MVFFFPPGWSVQPKGPVHWHQPTFNSLHACVRIDRDTLVIAQSAPPPPPPPSVSLRLRLFRETLTGYSKRLNMPFWARGPNPKVLIMRWKRS